MDYIKIGNNTKKILNIIYDQVMSSKNDNENSNWSLISVIGRVSLFENILRYNKLI